MLEIMARLRRNGEGGTPKIGRSRPERHSWLMKAGLGGRVKGKKKKAKTGTIRRLRLFCFFTKRLISLA